MKSKTATSIEVGDGNGKILVRNREEIFTSGWTNSEKGPYNLVETDDEDDFYNDLTTLIEDSDKCKDLAAQGKERRVEWFVQKSLKQIKSWIGLCRKQFDDNPTEDLWKEKQITFPGEEADIYCSYHFAYVMAEEEC